MVTVTTATAKATTTEKKPINWRTVWNVLVVLFWLALLIGIVGDFFIFKGKGSTVLGFKENGTLWNWLQLLSAPVFVTILPFVFKGPHASTDHADEQQKQLDSVDSSTADNSQQEVAVEAYLNRMSELLLEKDLKTAPVGSSVQEVAQAWTLTVLRRADKNHKGAVLQFLHEAGLIYKGKAIINLSEVNLSGADLSKAKLNGTQLGEVDLSETNLNGTNLTYANLRGANLLGTDLSGADLSGADLSGALVTQEQLAKARSLQGAVMPNGSKYS